MIPTEEQRGTAAFDLEKARAMICHYRIENPGDADTDCGLEDLIRQANLAEEALDEIERLNAHINSARIESLRIAEEQAAEIERLRASLIDLHAEYINTLEKNPECSAWDLDEQSIEDQRRLRRNAAHAISIVEPPIYLQADQQATKILELEAISRRRNEIINKQVAKIKELEADLEQAERVIEARLEVIDQQAARIKSLKKEIRRLKHESKVEQELTNSYIKHLHEAEARIKELKEAHKRSGAKYAKIINELRSSVYANIPGLKKQWDEIPNAPANGKIGPDADAKPHCWQITDERKAVILHCKRMLTFLKEDDAPCYDVEKITKDESVLVAMLEEAQP